MTVTRNEDGDDATAILGRIGVTLPPAARVDYAERISGLDDAARLAATMPEADWAALRLRLGERAGGAVALAEEDNVFLGPDKDGWTPRHAAGLKTAQLDWAGGREILNVGAAPGAPGQVRLFLFWHQR